MKNKDGLTKGQRWWLRFLQKHGPGFIRDYHPDRYFCYISISGRSNGRAFQPGGIRIARRTIETLVAANLLHKEIVHKPCAGVRIMFVEDGSSEP